MITYAIKYRFVNISKNTARVIFYIKHSALNLTRPSHVKRKNTAPILE